MNWLNLSKSKQQELFKQLSFKTGIQPQAIEKDAWVTLALRITFNSELANHLVFKGGTSLSKAYGLIKRFSEDIDIAINQEFLGFTGELSKGQIRKLRRKSHEFVLNEMSNIIIKEFSRYNIDNLLFKIEVENIKITDQDPEIIKITYQSVFDELSYIPRKVIIEIGARSLLEPSENKEIKSIIDENYPENLFTEESFVVKTILPEKTILEKMILLHEEFTKPKEKIRYHRMSRHLYDIGQIISTEFGERALKNESLFQEIIKHRAKYTPIKTVDYSKLELNKLKIIPPDEFIGQYEKDYSEMQENMIYGEKISFNNLINKILSKTPSR
ncbi:MAG TPA: nucleotidyl transferase AbiEii/AbiGii toxin family protein [Ignavibacteria bacterium]|nr:nucleotidyl transferase AbiEii/AbiGii toxin family protein [Ignavibacteria bacterium]